MESYVLKYVKSPALKHNVHPSWYELCEKQTSEDIIKALKKHLYEPGEYTVYFNAFNGTLLRKNNQYFFNGWVVRKNSSIIDDLERVGMALFDYYDDTLDNFDFKNTWPEIDCENALVNPTARFTLVEETFMPSAKEYEIICDKSAERFIKRLHKSVNFPLEIACDYPDVIFEICYETKPEPTLVEDTLKVIEEYVQKYNKRHENGIHYVANAADIIKRKKSNAVYVHIDFGNCNIDVLALVIKAIGKSNLPIKKITLK